MNIHHSNTPAILSAFENAMQEEKLFLAIDSKVQMTAVTDLHFFNTHQQAVDFQDFNRSMQKLVEILPIYITWDAIHESVNAQLKSGVQHFIVKIDPAEMQELNEQYLFHRKVSQLADEMDSFNWNHVFYDPLYANAEAESSEDKNEFNRLECLVEDLSAFSQTGDRAKTVIEEMLNHYWKEQPMEIQIAPVLQGQFTNKSNALIADTQSYINSPINNQVMNMENLKYLQDNLKYTGFGDALYPELEKNIAARIPEFQLHFSTQVGNKPFDAVLDFRKSNTSDMYFFNRYKASIEKSNGEKLTQSFAINKGKGVTAKEAFNLLQGRAVYHDLTNSKGEAYKAWIQLVFDKKDDKGNYVVNKFNDNYGYDLRDSVAKFPVKELDGGEAEKNLLRSLERGNAQTVTFDMGGTDQKFIIEANPVYKTLNVYDEKFVMQKHENLPKKELSESASQSQSDTQQRSSQSMDQKQGPRNGATQKNDALVTKKRTGKNKGMKI